MSKILDSREPRGSTRREFLFTTAASLIAGAHAVASGVNPVAGGDSKPAVKVPDLDHRIRSLQLSTTTPLDEMRRYYTEVLERPVMAASDSRLTLGGGATPVTFELVDGDGPPPFYHVAFNIPENKWVEARSWLLDRTELSPNTGARRDPDYEDVVYFDHWDAHALFFLDPAGNILEFIARHTLDNAGAGPFTADDVHYASEIAFVFDDVPDAAESIKADLRLPSYRTSSPRFHAIGDERGLLLVMKRGVSLRGKAGVFPTLAVVRDAAPAQLQLPGTPYRIVRES